MELLQDNIQNLMFWSLYSFSTCKWRTSFEYCKVWGISMAKVKICKLGNFSFFPFKWTCTSLLLFYGGIWNNLIKIISCRVQDYHAAVGYTHSLGWEPCKGSNLCEANSRRYRWQPIRHPGALVLKDEPRVSPCACAWTCARARCV